MLVVLAFFVQLRVSTEFRGFRHPGLDEKGHIYKVTTNEWYIMVSFRKAGLIAAGLAGLCLKLGFSKDAAPVKDRVQQISQTSLQNASEDIASFSENAQQSNPDMVNEVINIPLPSMYKKSAALPDREILLDFNDPLGDHGSEAATKIGYSFNEIMGRVNDFLGVRCGLDENVADRMALLGLSLYSADVAESCVHEAAHIREASRFGPQLTLFRLRDWQFVNNFDKWSRYWPTLEQDMREAQAGLNADEQGALNVWQRSGNELNLSDAVFFLWTKCEDDAYILFYPTGELSDVRAFDEMLSEQGIPMTKSKYQAQAFIADAASVRTWESLAVIFQYLVNGDRTIEPLEFAIGDCKVTPPLISQYLTSRGVFYDARSRIKTGETSIELAFGFDGDFIAGKEDRLRAGIKVEGIDLGLGKHSPKFSPFAYVNTARDGSFKGFAGGSDVQLPVTSSLSLTATVEYAHDDAIETNIKGKYGLTVVGGIALKF